MSYKVTLFILRESTQGQRGSAKPSKNKPAKGQQVKSSREVRGGLWKRKLVFVLPLKEKNIGDD